MAVGKKRRILAGMLGIFSVCVIGANVYVKVESNKVKENMMSYLTEKRDYKEDDIKDIEVDHSFVSKIMGYTEWNIGVVYKDEDAVKYNYSYINEKIEPGGINSSNKDGVYRHRDDGDEWYKVKKSIQEKGYIIKQDRGVVNAYDVSEAIIQSSVHLTQVWDKQDRDCKEFIGKRVKLYEFIVNNHPLNKKYKEDIILDIMVVDGEIIGGYSNPNIDMVGGFYKLDGEDING